MPFYPISTAQSPGTGPDKHLLPLPRILPPAGSPARRRAATLVSMNVKLLRRRIVALVTALALAVALVVPVAAATGAAPAPPARADAHTWTVPAATATGTVAESVTVTGTGVTVRVAGQRPGTAPGRTS